MNRARKLAKRMSLQMFAGNLNPNTTSDSGMTAEMKEFYEKTLFTMAEPKFVFDKFGDQYPIPKNGGKIIEFRKYDSLPKNTKPLQEGVTPDGSKMTVTTVKSEVQQYGDYITLTDVLQLTAIDNNVVQATKLSGSQAGRTLDTITRDVISGGTNVMYANVYSKVQYQSLVKKNGTSIAEGNEGADLLTYAADKGMVTYEIA